LDSGISIELDFQIFFSIMILIEKPIRINQTLI